MSTDRIQKSVHLNTSKARVWRALTDSREFGSWFGMKLDGPFITNSILRGAIMPTTVDPEVAKMQEPYTGKAVELWIEEMKPESLFSFRWHPFAIDPKVDSLEELKPSKRTMGVGASKWS